MKHKRPPHGPARVEEHEHDPIARVLKFAGSRPQPDPERKAEFKRTLRAEWRCSIESREPQSREPQSRETESAARSAIGWRTLRDALRTRRGMALAAGIPAIAVLLLLVLLQPRYLSRQQPATTQVVARVVRSEGAVPNKAGDDVRAGAILDTGEAGRMALALGPGISLRMDVDSRIAMVGERVVRLERGAIYVDAGAGKSEPMLVQTPHGDVRDIGTQFEVRSEGFAFGVRVREGEILINRDGAEMTARAGEGLHVDREGRYVRRAIPIFGPEWAWTSTIAPHFRLEGGTVRQFLDWVAREQGWRWRFADTETARLAAGIVTHGSLEGYTPEEALAIVLPTCGLSFVQHGDEVVVSFAKEPSSRD